jgi:hypothetical protein
MCANTTGRAQAFLSAGNAAVSQEVEDEKISIQSACALNTRYLYPLLSHVQLTLKKKLRGFSPQANYTDQATAACRLKVLKFKSEIF